MSKTTVSRIGLALLVSASTTSLAWLVSPGSAQAPSESQEGQPDWIVMARASATQNGITVGEAVRRFRLQEKATRLAERLGSEDPNYGGSVIVQDRRNYRVRIAFKGPARAATSLTENNFYEPISGGGSRGPLIRMRWHVGEGGDSGGPWVYGNAAYGIHRGWVQAAATGQQFSVFTPVEHLSTISVRTLTSP